jgi:hypothetical protein
MDGGYHVHNNVVVSDNNDAVQMEQSFTWPLPRAPQDPHLVIPDGQLLNVTGPLSESLQTIPNDILLRYTYDEDDVLLRFTRRLNMSTDFNDTDSDHFLVFISGLHLSPSKYADRFKVLKTYADGSLYEYRENTTQADLNIELRGDGKKRPGKFPGRDVFAVYADVPYVYHLCEHYDGPVDDNPANENARKEKTVTFYAQTLPLNLKNVYSPERMPTFFLDYFQLRRYFFTGFQHTNAAHPFDEELNYMYGTYSSRRSVLLKSLKKLANHVGYTTISLQDLASYKFSFGRPFQEESRKKLNKIFDLIKEKPKGTQLTRRILPRAPAGLLGLAQDPSYGYQNVHATLWHLMTGRNPFYEQDLGRSEIFLCSNERNQVDFINYDVRPLFEQLRVYNPSVRTELESAVPYERRFLIRILDALFQAIVCLAVPDFQVFEGSSDVANERRNILNSFVWPDIRVQESLDIFSGLVFQRRIRSPQTVLNELSVTIDRIVFADEPPEAVYELQFQRIERENGYADLSVTLGGTPVDLSLLPFLGFSMYHTTLTPQELNPLVFRGTPFNPYVLPDAREGESMNNKTFHQQFQFFLQKLLQTYTIPFPQVPNLFYKKVQGPSGYQYPLTKSNVATDVTVNTNLTPTRQWYGCLFKYVSHFQLNLVSVFSLAGAHGTLRMHDLRTSTLIDGRQNGTQTVGQLLQSFLPLDFGPFIASAEEAPHVLAQAPPQPQAAEVVQAQAPPQPQAPPQAAEAVQPQAAEAVQAQAAEAVQAQAPPQPQAAEVVQPQPVEAVQAQAPPQPQAAEVVQPQPVEAVAPPVAFPYEAAMAAKAAKGAALALPFPYEAALAAKAAKGAAVAQEGNGEEFEVLFSVEDLARPRARFAGPLPDSRNLDVRLLVRI